MLTIQTLKQVMKRRRRFSVQCLAFAHDARHSQQRVMWGQQGALNLARRFLKRAMPLTIIERLRSRDLLEQAVDRLRRYHERCVLHLLFRNGVKLTDCA